MRNLDGYSASTQRRDGRHIAAPHRKSAATGDIKPPVFEFAKRAGQVASESRILAIPEPTAPVWTDDYCPAPEEF